MTVGPGALGPAQRGGDEVDGRLAPAGALHDEHRGAAPTTSAVDRLELAVAEVDVVAADEPPQRGRRSVAEGWARRRRRTVRRGPRWGVTSWHPTYVAAPTGPTGIRGLWTHGPVHGGDVDERGRSGLEGWGP